MTRKDFLFEADAPCMDFDSRWHHGQDEQRETTLVIANSSSMPVLLEKWELVGRLHGCEVF